MKDIFRVWNRVAGKTYSAVNTGTQDSAEAPSDGAQGLNKSVNCKRKKQNKKVFTLITLSLLSLGVGLFILLVNPYDFIFKWKVTFADKGEIFELWRKPEVELYLQIYLFNITNSEEFMKGKDQKLKFEQIGPYVYKEYLEHGNVTFNDNGTLSTLPIHPLEYQAHLSYPLKEDDMMMLPNIAFLSIAQLVSKQSIFLRLGLNAFLTTNGEKAIVKMTAKEFMFSYTSKLVSLGNTFMPGWISFGKMGLIDRMYDFDNDFETIYTGEDGVEKAGLFDTWRGSRNLPHWGDTKCANIHLASDGSKYPGNLKADDEVLFYRKSLCRAAPMYKVGDGERDGLSAYKFTFKKNILDNGHRDPENKCFCRQGKCLPDGLIDVTDCYYGFPIALSYPHFLDANVSMLESVEGLSPKEDDHRSYIWLEPESGLPLEVSAKFQINLAMGDIDSIYGAKKFSHKIIPLLWFDIRMFNLPESMAKRFVLYLKIIPIIVKVLMCILLVAAGPLFIAGVFLKLRRRRNKPSKHTPVIWDDNSPYAKSLRKLSLEIERSKMQSVYIPCELPLKEHSESDAPFLNSQSKASSSESDEDSDVHNTSERRSSLIKTHTDKIKEIGMNFSNRIQDNIDELSKNIKNFTRRFSIDNEKNSRAHVSELNINYEQSSDEDNNHSEKRRFSMPGDILKNYQIMSSSDDESCEVEVMGDGSEFDAPPEEVIRRKSIETCKKMDWLNAMETDIL